jgi:hypothetical protein
MEGLFILVILYIIFSLFSSVIRKGKSKSIPQQQAETPSSAQLKAEDLVEKLQGYFGQTKQPEQKAPRVQAGTEGDSGSKEKYQIISREKLAGQQQPVFESTDTELDLVLQEPPEEEFQKRSAAVLRRLTPPPLPRKTPQLRPASPASLLAFDKRRGYLQGIILSEILGPPVSQRRDRKFRR